MPEPSSERLLRSLERLIRIPTRDLRVTMIQACDLLSEALQDDKVDLFPRDPARESLSALCSSNQPLSALQRSLGLDVLPIVNGERVVWVY